jgi:PAS domain S-box-containing protein
MSTVDYATVLAHAASDAMIALSPTGDVLWWGEGAAGIFGYRAEEVLNRPLAPVLRPIADLSLVDAGDQSLEDAIGETLVTRSAVWTAVVHRKDGDEVHVEAVLRRVDPEGWIAFAGRDASDRVRLTRDLLVKTWMLELALADAKRLGTALVHRERLAAIGELAAGIGHDLRNPLAAIRNALHYMSKRLDPTQVDQRIIQFIGLAHKELNVCEETIAGLLDFARDRPLIVTTCAIGPLLADAILVVAVPSHVTIDVDAPSTLPRIEADATQLRRALVNLVQNACEAMPSSRTGRIRVSAVSEPAWVTITVADDGDGIAPEVRGRIFDPLFTTKTRGTGLGLAVVARVVERHAGTVAVEHVVPHGTAFLVRLPSKPPLAKNA